MKESVKVLQECAELQVKKGNDYQNEFSRIKQADYYPNGVSTLLDINHAKMLRMQSVVSAMMADPTYQPNFESIEDSAKDMINYCSFIVSYCRGKMDGQDPTRDFLNRPNTKLKQRPVEYTKPEPGEKYPAREDVPAELWGKDIKEVMSSDEC
jgi:hypothetical protein